MDTNLLSTARPDLAAQWHPTLNGDLRPDQIKLQSNKQIWWLDEYGHEWQSPAASRTRKGYGCPYCSGRLALAGVNDLATLRPDLAAQWHPMKNPPADQFKPVSGKKAWWLDEHGQQLQRAACAMTDG